MIRPPPRPPLFPYTTLFRSTPARIALHTSGALSSDALAPLSAAGFAVGSLHPLVSVSDARAGERVERSEEHTSELQSRFDLVCRLLLEKKKNTNTTTLYSRK